MHFHLQSYPDYFFDCPINFEFDRLEKTPLGSLASGDVDLLDGPDLAALGRRKALVSSSAGGGDGVTKGSVGFGQRQGGVVVVCKQNQKSSKIHGGDGISHWSETVGVQESSHSVPVP